MNFSEIIKTAGDEGKEKHVPTITVDKGYKEGSDIVRVVVGHETAHPNTEAHHIAWIELYGVKKKQRPDYQPGTGHLGAGIFKSQRSLPDQPNR